MACTEKPRALNVKKVNPQRELITRYCLNGTCARTLSFVVTRLNEAPVGVKNDTSFSSNSKRQLVWNKWLLKDFK